MLLSSNAIRYGAGAVVAFSLVPLYLWVTELAALWVPWLVFWLALLLLPYYSKLSYEARGLGMIVLSIACSAATPLLAAQHHLPLPPLDQALVTQFSLFYAAVGGGVGGNFMAHGLIEREKPAKARK